MPIHKYEENGKKLFQVYVNRLLGNGKRFQKRVKEIESLRKAQDIEFEILREIAKTKEFKAYRWEEWMEICLNRMKGSFQNSTVFNYQTTLNKWITPNWKGREIATINRDDVYRAIFEGTDSRLSPGSRKNLLKFVKRLFQMAYEEGCIQRNPCLGIRVRVPEVEQKVLTAAEATILLEKALHHEHPYFEVWAVALMTGMRSGELFALRWTDVDFESKIIQVSRQWTSYDGFGPTKSRRTRAVPISEDLLQFLKELKLKSGAAEFVLPRLTSWEHGDQAKITKEFCESIGITAVKFHDLRATFITSLLARGESLARVMHIVGHTELRTTNAYLRRAGVDVKSGTDKLGYKIPESRPGELIELRRF